MAEAFYNYSDASMYLDGCVCLWKGRPVLVQAGHQEDLKSTKFKVYDLLDNKESSTVDYTDSNFDYKSVPLGYFYHQGRAYYASRLPWRKTKQGVHWENTRCSCPHDYTFSMDVATSLPAFGKMILGEYVSETEALNMLLNDKGVFSVPISRSIAIARDKKDATKYNLYYKNELVATKHFGNSHFTMISSEASSVIKRIVSRHVQYLQ